MYLEVGQTTRISNSVFNFNTLESRRAPYQGGGTAIQFRCLLYSTTGYPTTCDIDMHSIYVAHNILTAQTRLMAMNHPTTTGEIFGTLLFSAYNRFGTIQIQNSTFEQWCNQHIPGPDQWYNLAYFFSPASVHLSCQTFVLVLS
jgi:hypothetical protein